MATNTANYNLKKPAQEDFYNVDEFNDNMDIIDNAIQNAGANKIDKVSSGTEGNVAILTAAGGVADSGLKFAVVNGGLQITYDDGSET